MTCTFGFLDSVQRAGSRDAEMLSEMLRSKLRVGAAIRLSIEQELRACDIVGVQERYKNF